MQPKFRPYGLLRMDPDQYRPFQYISAHFPYNNADWYFVKYVLTHRRPVRRERLIINGRKPRR